MTILSFESSAKAASVALVRDGELIVISSDKIVFRCPVDQLRASELMSLEGVILTCPDPARPEGEYTVVAYYTDFYKMVTKV